LFQTEAAATMKARSPIVERRVAGLSVWWVIISVNIVHELLSLLVSNVSTGTEFTHVGSF